jgi:hypothetical protein
MTWRLGRHFTYEPSTLPADGPLTCCIMQMVDIHASGDAACHLAKSPTESGDEDSWPSDFAESANVCPFIREFLVTANDLLCSDREPLIPEPYASRLLSLIPRIMDSRKTQTAGRADRLRRAAMRLPRKLATRDLLPENDLHAITILLREVAHPLSRKSRPAIAAAMIDVVIEELEMTAC